MSIRDDKKLLEGAIYASEHPLTLKDMKRLLGTSSDTYVRKLIEELKSSYRRRDKPFFLSEEGHGTFSFKLREDMEKQLGNLVPKVKISKGVMKTLAVVAYKQNVPLAKLAELRGSRTYEHVKQLRAVGFIEVKPYGRTRLLRTSKKFAAHMGLEDDPDLIREWFERRAQ